MFSQTVVAKLVNINGSISEKYDIIRRSLENSLKTGNAVKNAIKLQNDFYFSYFRPMEHFSFEVSTNYFRGFKCTPIVFL